MSRGSLTSLYLCALGKSHCTVWGSFDAGLVDDRGVTMLHLLLAFGLPTFLSATSFECFNSFFSNLYSVFASYL